MTKRKVMKWAYGPRRGRPVIANADKDRCQALTPMTDWKIANKREQRCIFVSKYLVNGHEFCRHHAVMEAMAIAIERGIVSRIPRHPLKQDCHVMTVRETNRAKRGRG